MASAGMGSLLIELVDRKRKLDEAKALEEALTAAAAAAAAGATTSSSIGGGTTATADASPMSTVQMVEDDEKSAMEVLNTILVDHQGGIGMAPLAPSGAVDENAMIAGVAGAARAEQLLYGKSCRVTYLSLSIHTYIYIHKYVHTCFSCIPFLSPSHHTNHFIVVIIIIIMTTYIHSYTYRSKST